MTFGERVRKLRKERNFTQQELANKLHITQQAVVKIEKMAYAPKYETLKKIATALDTTVAELTRDTYEFRDVDTTQEAQEASRERAKATMDYHALKREAATLKEQLDDNFNAVPIEGKRKITGYSEDIKKAYQTQK